MANKGEKTKTKKQFRISSPQEICSPVYDRYLRQDQSPASVLVDCDIKRELVGRWNGFEANFPIYLAGIR
jgi:hypothetical protein